MAKKRTLPLEVVTVEWVDGFETGSKKCSRSCYRSAQRTTAATEGAFPSLFFEHLQHCIMTVLLQ